MVRTTNVHPFKTLVPVAPKDTSADEVGEMSIRVPWL